MKKECTKCEQLKDESCFYKCARAPDGLRWKCKECHRGYSRKYGKENREQQRKAKKRWRKENPEKVKEMKRRYREKVAEKHGSVYQKNKDEYWYIREQRYEKMKKRVRGDMPHYTSAEGKEICSREEFYKWCDSTKEKLMSMHEKYKESGYDLSLCPTVDRIDPEEGYVVSNLQWLTFSENSSKAEKERDEQGRFANPT